MGLNGVFIRRGGGDDVGGRSIIFFRLKGDGEIDRCLK